MRTGQSDLSWARICLSQRLHSRPGSPICSIRLGYRDVCTLQGSGGSLVCCTASDPLCLRMLPLAWAQSTCRSDLSWARICLSQRLHSRPGSPICSIRLGCRGLCTLRVSVSSQLCCTASDHLCPRMLAVVSLHVWREEGRDPKKDAGEREREEAGENGG
jgi:hypothetical protein